MADAKAPAKRPVVRVSGVGMGHQPAHARVLVRHKGAPPMCEWCDEEPAHCTLGPDSGCDFEWDGPPAAVCYACGHDTGHSGTPKALHGHTEDGDCRACYPLPPTQKED